MGIKGIYQEIGPGQRIALSKLAVETFEQKGRPLRLAIDVSIWLFQIQSGQGGTNPALRTFYYRLLRLISLSIHPLFIFDGPNKPPFKRGKRTGPNVASIPEFLAKQLLKQFGLPFHIAPGEAEAECAHLQRHGLVDAVLSEDVDTLMFGSGLTLRNWTSDKDNKKGTPTHVNVYDAQKTRDNAGMDREGMILVALMSGGDYVPEGIPGCGPKTACQAARAGFGKDLCAIDKSDHVALTAWKDRLTHELRTNESKYFQRKSKALVIPEDFPRRDILRYYTHPCLSSDDRVERLRSEMVWDQEIDFKALRTFTGEAFEWICIGGAKKFIRNLAPALLVKELRKRGQTGEAAASDDTSVAATTEEKLVQLIEKRRNHITTDGVPEVKIGFIPHNLVPIDLDAEDADPELPMDGLESDDEPTADADGEPGSPKKKRGPSQYDPTQMEKIWVLETYVKVGVPFKMQDWEESFRNVRKYEQMKADQREMRQKAKAAKTAGAKGGMSVGALDRFAKAMKPGRMHHGSKDSNSAFDMPPASQPMSVPRALSELAERPASTQIPVFRLPASTQAPPLRPRFDPVDTVDLLSSPARSPSSQRQSTRSHTVTSASHDAEQVLSVTNRRSWLEEPMPDLPSSVTRRRKRSPVKRAQTLPNATVMIDSDDDLPPTLTRRSQRTLGPPTEWPSSTHSTPRKRQASNKVAETINLLSSSPGPATPRHRQRSIADWLSPSPHKARPVDATHPPRTSGAADPEPTIHQDEEDPFLDPRRSGLGAVPDGVAVPRSNACRLPLQESFNSANSKPPASQASLSSSDENIQPALKEFRMPGTSSTQHQPSILLAHHVTLHPGLVARLRGRDAPTTESIPSTAVVAVPVPAPPPNTITNMTQLKHTTRTIRLRDSLPGTYAHEILDLTETSTSTSTSISTTAYQQESEPSNDGRKRKVTQTQTPSTKARSREAQAQKRWRVSGVEVLDLS